MLKQFSGNLTSSGLSSARIQNIFISALSAGLSFYSLSLIGTTYGASQGSDSYFYLISVLTLFSGVVTSLFGTIFLPQFVAIRMNDGIDGASEFASCTFTWSCLVFIPISAAIYFQYINFFELASKFTYQQLLDMKYVLGYFAPLLVLSVLAEFFRVNGLALGKFIQSAICGLFQPLLLVIDLIYFSSEYNEESLAISLLASRILICFLMVWSVVGIEKIKIKLTIKPNREFNKFLIHSIPYGGANIVTIFANFFFDYMASGLSSGVLTALSFAQKIAALPVILIINPILDIARTQFAVIQSKKNQNEMAIGYKKVLTLLLYSCVPIAFLFIAIPDSVVLAVFHRGAFSVESAGIAGNALRVYGFSLIFSCVFLLNGRFVESYQRLMWPSFFGVIGNFLLIGLSFLLVIRLGYIGIPLSRLLIEVIYFLPFGLIAAGIFNKKLITLPIKKDIVQTFLVSILCAFITKYAILNILETFFNNKLLFYFILFSFYFASIGAIYSLIYWINLHKKLNHENIS